MTNKIVTLNNGKQMPLVGLGVYDMHAQEAEEAVSNALETGYRLLDTAAMYGNEREIGNAVHASSIPREDLFITTKVNNGDHGFDETLRAYDQSLEKLRMDYVDLYLVHWPIKGKRKQTWMALEKLYEEGRVKAIGVANYTEPFLEELMSYTHITPALNQVEFTPWLYNKTLLNECRRLGIQLQSYSPLTRGEKFSDPVVQQLSRAYGKTPAQIILRWNIQLGVSVIPKTVRLQRLRENADLFDFVLSEPDMEKLSNVQQGFRICPNPISML